MSSQTAIPTAISTATAAASIHDHSRQEDDVTRATPLHSHGDSGGIIGAGTAGCGTAPGAAGSINNRRTASSDCSSWAT